MKQPGKGDKVLLILYALGLGVYFVLRFGGNWMEIDTARITQAAQATFEEAALTPARGSYDHGFTYPVMVAWLAHFTGVSVLRLQTVILPVVGIVMLALVAVVLFEAILGKTSMALLATLLLCLQADFLFVTSRGSHEKLTWPLAMLALYFLYCSAAKPQGLKRFVIHVVLFYLAIYALITTNSFFASTLITAITLSFLLGLTINRWQIHLKEQATPGNLQRLALVSASSMILLYLFVFYIYTPARNALSILPTMVDQIAMLLFGFQPQVNPYAYISWGWISPQIYLVLALFTWLLLLGSLAEWIHQGYRLLCGARLHLPEALPWLLYAGFAIQIVIATVLDFAGVLSANLQLRVLPGLVVFAVVLVVQGLEHLLSQIRLSYQARRLLFVGCILLVAWFVFASLLKTTNDPVVSNKWGFYSTAEKSAVQWTDTHLKRVRVWVGIDERLSTVYSVLYPTGSQSDSIVVEIGVPRPTTRYLLLSETEQLRHARLRISLPVTVFKDQVYDNGGTKLYRKRPETPYQR
jgi:hypothetical protein